MTKTPPPHPPTFGILGHVGNQNLGDEAIISAVIQNIRSGYPDARICAFTINPEDTQKRHGIPAYPLRRIKSSAYAVRDGAAPTSPARDAHRLPLAKRLPILYAPLKLAHNALIATRNVAREIGFLRRGYSHLRGVDLLIIAGSQQLNDFVGGPWAFPYTLYKWSMLARIRKARVVFLSVGAGPITSRLGRFFIRQALSVADYRSYRDSRSLSLVEKLQVKGSHVLVPDLVFSYDVPAALPAPVTCNARPVVGINPLPLFHSGYWHEGDQNAYRQYVAMLAEFADRLVARGFRVSFFSTQLKVDPGVISDILDVMRNPLGPDVIAPSIQGFDHLTAAIRAMDFVVATRYHGILISLLLEKPVLALAYHGKSRDLMEMSGLGDYCLDAQDCAVSSLETRFLAMVPKCQEITQQLRTSLPRYRRALADQYGRLSEPRRLALPLATPECDRLQAQK